MARISTDLNRIDQVFDITTGKEVSYTKIVRKPDGTLIVDADCDGLFLRKWTNGFYYLMNNIGSFSIKQFGGIGDINVIDDLSVIAGSNIVNSTSTTFTSLDIGKRIYITSAGTLYSGSTYNALVATITTINSSTQIVVSTNALRTLPQTSATYGTDSTSAFQLLNSYARLFPTKAISIYLEPGTYMTSFNSWTSGIKSIEVIGNGASIICTKIATSPTTPSHLCAGLKTPSVFDRFDNNPAVLPGFYGHRIETTDNITVPVPSDNSTVTLSTLSDSSNYKIGDWVVVYGREVENISFPPNPRYFDYAKIKGVNHTNGTITLDRKLNNRYFKDWPDQIGLNGTTDPGMTGAARIINCKRSDFTIVENLTIRDLSFLAFSGWTGPTTFPNGRFELYGYINAILSNVKSPVAYVGQGKTIELQGCEFTAGCEIDKVIDKLVFRRSIVNTMAAASGVNSMTLENCEINGTFFIDARNIICNNNTFNTTSAGSSRALATFGLYHPVLSLTLGNNYWCCNVPRTALINPSNNTPIYLTINEVVDSSKILVSKSNYSLGHCGLVWEGSIGFTKTPPNKKRIIVNKVSVYDSDNILIEGNFSQIPVTGDIFYFNCAPKLSIIGKQSKIGNYSKSFATFGQENAQPESGWPGTDYRDLSVDNTLKKMLLREEDIVNGSYAFRWVFGYPLKMIINVIKPYTGPDATAQLKFDAVYLNSFGPATSFFETIDLKTPGIRIIELAGCAGSNGTDILNNIDSSYTEHLRFKWQGAGSNFYTLGTTDTTLLPIFQVYFESLSYTC